MPRTPDPEVEGSSPTRVKPCCVLEQGTFTPKKYLVGEPKLRIMQKHKKNAPERYTAEFLYMECLNTG